MLNALRIVRNVRIVRNLRVQIHMCRMNNCMLNMVDLCVLSSYMSGDLTRSYVANERPTEAPTAKWEHSFHTTS